MNKWIGGWIDGFVDGKMDGWMNEYNWYNKTNKVDLGL